MRALLVMFLIVVILTPGLLLGFLASPWFFLILFLLLLLFLPVVFAPSPENWASLDSSGVQASPVLLVWMLGIAALVFALSVLVLGILLIPGFFLLILLVMAPLIYLTFRP